MVAAESCLAAPHRHRRETDGADDLLARHRSAHPPLDWTDRAFGSHSRTGGRFGAASLLFARTRGQPPWSPAARPEPAGRTPVRPPLPVKTPLADSTST